VISVAIEPKTKADQDKLGIGLQRLTEEDPTFKVHTDDETGQTIIAGMGELHLEIIVDRLLREFKVDANQGKPQVAYKEAIKKPAHGVGRFIRQSGGKGQFGHAEVDVRPGETSSGYVFEDKITQGRIPREFIPSVEKGVREALQTGVVAGYPVLDLVVTLVDGSFHAVDSNDMAFQVAGSMAVKDAIRKASPYLLEPIMKVDVVMPEEYLGDVMGDLASRPGDLFDGVQSLRRDAGKPGRSRRPPHHVAKLSRRNKWRRRSSSGQSRTSTSAPSVTSTTVRRR
jgi:elongation factor G